MSKVIAITLLLLAQVTLQSWASQSISRSLGQKPMTTSQVANWETALKAKETHLAAEIKFHTSELKRYEERDRLHAEVAEIMSSSEGTFLERCMKILAAYKKSLTWQRKENLMINTNLSARRAPLNAYEKALRTARTGQRRLAETEESVQGLFEAWHTKAVAANAAETKFHNVEFTDFKGQQDCVDAARKRLANPAELTRRDMNMSYVPCMKTNQRKIKQAIVNVADKNRKTERKGLGKLWTNFMNSVFGLQKALGAYKGNNMRRKLFANYTKAVKDLNLFLNKM